MVTETNVNHLCLLSNKVLSCFVMCECDIIIYIIIIIAIIIRIIMHY